MTGGPIGSAVGALTAGAGDARYAKRSNNLSDLTSASSARTSLGLGASAVMSTAEIAADSALTGTYAGLHRPAFEPLAMALQDGVESPGLVCLSDSTANDTDEWPYLLASHIAGLYPNLRVLYRLWNDTNQDYDRPTVVQAGSSGERTVTLDGTITLQGNGDGTNNAGDHDVRVKLIPQTGLGSTIGGVMAALFGSAGSRAWRFGIGLDGKIWWDWTTDGTTIQTAVRSNVITGDLTVGVPVWLRVTFQVSDGSGNRVTTFYTSADGITWTQRGQTTTVGTTTVFTVSRYFELGGRGDTSELTPGTFCEVEIRNGIAGPLITPAQVDAWIRTNDTHAVYGGTPTLTVYDGSQSGAGFTYHLDSTRIKRLNPLCNAAQVILALLHNSSWVAGNVTSTNLDTWYTTLKSRHSTASFAALTENPKISSLTTASREMAMRRRIWTAWASRNNAQLIDTYGAFKSNPAGLAALIAGDGIHPVGAGKLVTSGVVNAAFDRTQALVP